MGEFLTIGSATDGELARLAREAAGLGPAAAAADAREREEREARLRVFDLHCDTLDRLALSGDPAAPGGFYEHDRRVPRARMSRLADNDAHISLARTAAFRWTQCFAVFVPDEVRGDGAWAFYRRVQRFWEMQRIECRETLAEVRNVADIDAAHEADRTAGLLTVEGAAFLEDDGTAEGRLDALAADGVRMVTLTWNGRNALGSGHDTREGLTAFGRACVRELEDRAIAVDVSHLNDEGFKDVCACARRPFAASHSNARAVCGHPRNLADWQLRELADCGGVAGLNFCGKFLSDVHADPTPDDVLRHLDHVLTVAGEDVPALGSDYDGCDVPTWLNPCNRVADLRTLVESEFGPTIAQKLFHDNATAFFNRIES